MEVRFRGSAVLAVTAFVAASCFLQTPTALGQAAIVTGTYSGPDTVANGAIWNNGANWSTNPSYPSGVGAEAIFTSTQAATRVVPLGEAITVGTLRIDNTLNNLNNTIGQDGGPVLTFDAAGDGPARIFRTGNATGTGANVDAVRGSIFLADDLVINVDLVKNAADAIALNFIQAGGSSFTAAAGKGITKNGTGVLALADSDKSISGPLIINQGRVRLNAAARFPNVSSITINAGGQITNQRIFSAGTPYLPYGPGATPGIAGTAPTINLNGHGLIGFGTGIADVPGAIRTDTSTTINSLQQILNPINLQTESSINVVRGPTSTMNLDGIVSGAGRLVAGRQPGNPADAGILVLRNDNTYSGGTLVEQGTLVVSDSLSTVGAAADLGTGNVFVDGRTVNGTTVGSGTSIASGILRIEEGVANAIANTATLTLTGDEGSDAFIGGRIDLEANVNETVGGLVLNGITQTVLGTYGSSTSLATFKNDAFFSGLGMITLAAPPGVAGDYNGNGVVDAADYVVWRNGGPLQNEVASVTPGTVTAEDYDAWRARFGNISASGSGSGAAVPEPAALGLAGLLFSLLRFGNRQKRSTVTI